MSVGKKQNKTKTLTSEELAGPNKRDAQYVTYMKYVNASAQKADAVTLVTNCHVISGDHVTFYAHQQW